MHHGTCVAHLPWCMSGSLTRRGEKNVPCIPGACECRNFTYLARGPWESGLPYLIWLLFLVWMMKASGAGKLLHSLFNSREWHLKLAEFTREEVESMIYKVCISQWQTFLTESWSDIYSGSNKHSHMFNFNIDTCSGLSIRNCWFELIRKCAYLILVFSLYVKLYNDEIW